MSLLHSLATLVVLAATPPWTAATVFITDHTMRHMVSFTELGRCFAHVDRRTIIRAVLTSLPHQVRTTSAKEMQDLMNACIQHNLFHTNENRAFIFPGTKWCGPGNKASGPDDLGVASGEDSCCREHDSCPSFLYPGQCMENVCNISPFTRSECSCDAKFMKCLKAVGSTTADTIGYIFFNIAKVKCFHNNTPCAPNEVVGFCGFDTSGRYRRSVTNKTKRVASFLNKLHRTRSQSSESLRKSRSSRRWLH